MYRIPLTKFAKIIQSAEIQTVIFASIHQTSCILSDVSIDGCFENISVMHNPNRIFLYNNNNESVCFNRVKAIIAYDKPSSDRGQDFGIVCGSALERQDSKTYRISVIKSM